MKGLACAHPDCDYAVTDDRQFGGFCCKRCHAAFVRGDPATHGAQCSKASAKGLKKAEPLPPEAPLAESTSKRAWQLARQNGREDAAQRATKQKQAMQEETDEPIERSEAEEVTRDEWRTRRTRPRSRQSSRDPEKPPRRRRGSGGWWESSEPHQARQAPRSRQKGWMEEQEEALEGRLSAEKLHKLEAFTSVTWVLSGGLPIHRVAEEKRQLDTTMEAGVSAGLLPNRVSISRACVKSARSAGRSRDSDRSRTRSRSADDLHDAPWRKAALEVTQEQREKHMARRCKAKARQAQKLQSGHFTAADLKYGAQSGNWLLAPNGQSDICRLCHAALRKRKA
ncbi:unnamed protein product [Durusdinium trenchii]|uniref:Uncharacterized protein n=1 Tax=Durusdinium trenchii TaxID=1381693 RepID=A0ABP0PEH6_9DINO